ncbi:MAG: hypothetical protein ACLQGJ_01715 [Candidatus Dormibacteria bacterium]
MSEPAPAATVTAPAERRRRLLPRAAGALLLVLAALTAALASPAAVRADPASPTPAPIAGSTTTPLPTASPTASPSVTPLPTASPRYSGSGGIISNLIFGPAINAVANWITQGAAASTTLVIGLFAADPANPDLTAPWFMGAYYGSGSASGRTGPPGSVVIAAWLMLLVVIASVMSGVIRGDIPGMIRLLFVRLPVAIFVTFIAIWLVSELLALTNLATSWEVIGGMHGLATWSLDLTTANLGTDFLTVLASLVLIAATLLCYLELLARDAAVYIVAAFVPLIALASLWPGAHHALKRGAETLFVLCISKFVMAFVLVLGAEALTASMTTGNFGALVAAALIFLLAAIAPFAVFRLLPILEATAVAGMVGGASGFGKRAGAAAVRTGGRVGAAVGSGGTSEAVGGGATLSKGSGAVPTPGAGGGPGGSSGPDQLKLAGAGGQPAGGPGSGGAPSGAEPGGGGQPAPEAGSTPAPQDAFPASSGGRADAADAGPAIASTRPRPTTPQQEGSPA